MEEFKAIEPGKISGNAFDLIGRQWMLITAGDKSGFNTMTASWGGLGVLWGGPAAFCFVRPQRYTDVFLKKSDRFSLSFYDERWRKALSLCGSKSGRDCDKVAEAGLTPVFDDGTVYFEQARLVLVCRKLYMDAIRPGSFLVPEIAKNYPDRDYHNVYIGAVEKALTR
jgi:flavin reductase (DIM6/NTAB) family NADH-FMN oxidoreductase RutF